MADHIMPNPDLSPEQLQALKALIAHVLNGDESVATVIVLRIKRDGTTYPAAGSRIMEPAELVPVLASACADTATQAMRAYLTASAQCNCAACIEKRGTITAPTLGGPIAHA